MSDPRPPTCESRSAEPTPPSAEEGPDDVPATAELFDPATTARVLVVQNVVPLVATGVAFVLFRFGPVVGP